MKVQGSIINRNNNDSTRGTFKPQLTSLIDIMTILLIFLIKSFSVEGNIITPSPDLELPVSTSKAHPKPITTIEITKNSIVSGGKTITTFEEFSKNEDMKIAGLFSYLKDKNPEGVAKDKGKELMIQSDKEIEFNIIKRVMYTCSKAGYSDFTVLVIQEG